MGTTCCLGQSVLPNPRSCVLKRGAPRKRCKRPTDADAGSHPERSVRIRGVLKRKRHIVVDRENFFLKI